MEGCSIFGSSLVLFKVQMTGYIRNLEFIPLKIGYQGCRGGLISQQKSIFAEEGPFRSPFRSCEIRLLCCEMAHECQRGVSQLRKFSQRGVLGCEIYFATEGHFRSQTSISQRTPKGCEIISQAMVIFAGDYFGLRNFADH